MTRDVTEPIDYAELERMYNETMTTHKACTHYGLAVTTDDNGMFRAYCDKCGMLGFSNKDAAQRLGWI